MKKFLLLLVLCINLQIFSFENLNKDKQQDGILNSSFGVHIKSEGSGIVNPFYGKDHALLQQKGKAAIEIKVMSENINDLMIGDIIVGIDGSIDSTAITHMMLACLKPDGTMNATVNMEHAYPGFLILENLTGDHEYINNIFQLPQGTILVAGYSKKDSIDTQKAFLRAYNTTSTSGWTEGKAIWQYTEEYDFHQIIDIRYQSNLDIILLYIDEGNHSGHISACSLDGKLSTNFGENNTGKINALSYGLHMGPCYQGCVDEQDNIIIAYKDFNDNYVKVVSFLPDGSELQKTFANQGISNHLFDNMRTIEADQIRCCKDAESNLIVIAIDTYENSILLTSMTKNNDDNYKNNIYEFEFSKIIIENSNSLHIKNLIAVNDGSLLIALHGISFSKDEMYLIRTNNIGQLDTTFNAQGTQPGICSLKFDNNFHESYMPTSILIQSTLGQYQGNIIATGFSSKTNFDAQPIVLNIFGAQGSQQIEAHTSTLSNTLRLFRSSTPGTYISATNLSSSPAISHGFGNVIYVYPSTNANAGKILVGIDNGSTSTISRFTLSGTTLTLDTGFGTSGTYTIAGSLTGVESIATDSSNNILVAGTTTGGGATAWAKIINNAGSSITTCSLGASIKAAHKICQQISGGRYIVAGDTGSAGILIGVTTAGAVDTTFGSSGSFNVSNPVYSIALNSDSTILITYKNSSSLLVSKVAANGSGLVTSFGTSGTLTTSISASNSRNCQVIIDNTAKVIAAAGTGGNVVVQRFTPTGGTDLSWNSNGSATTIANLGSGGVTLGSMMATTYNQIILVGNNNSGGNGKLFAACLSFSGVLDASWNPSPTSPDTAGVLTYSSTPSPSATVINNGMLANDGTVLSAGSSTSNSSTSDPIVTFIVGATVPTGTLIYANNLGASGSPAISNGFGKVVYAYPSDNVNAGQILVGIDTGTTSLISRMSASSLVLDTSFGTSGTYTIAGSLTGISTLSIDSNNNILAGGLSGSTPWAQVINNTGTSTTSCNITGLNLTSVNRIFQQTSGRYILAGNTSSAGILVAFQDRLVGAATQFAIDPTFNPLAFGGATSGTYLIGTTGIYRIAINSDDTILAVYKNASNFLAVAKVTADGSGLVTSFGTSGTLTTAITPDSSAVCRVVVDSSGKVIVGTSAGTGTSVKIQRFTSTGTTDTTWNSTGAVTTISNLGTAGITLSNITESTTGQTVFVGYNSAGGNGRLFIGRLDASGALDSTWNSTPTSPDTAGVLTYNSQSAINVNSGTIANDGNIISFCSTSATASSSNPIITFGLGSINVGPVSQSQKQTAAGILDTTMPSGSSGSWALSSTLTGAPQKIAIYNNNSNGAIMIGSSTNSNSYVTKLNADLSIGTYGTSGIATLSSLPYLSDIYVTNSFNANGTSPILVTGPTAAHASTMWGGHISADGTTITYLGAGSGLTYSTAIRQTNNGRFLVAGYNGTNGSIAAFGSTTSDGTYPLDTSFGINGSTPGGGMYTNGVNAQIADIAIDSLDRIYIAYKSSSTTIAIQRLLANGTALDSTFNATFTVGTSYSASQICLALDMTNNQVVVAAQDQTSVGNIIQVKRFNTSNGSNAGSTSAVTITAKVLNISDLFIDAAQNIYVVGYNSTDNKSIVARISSTSSTVIALDTANYALSGGTPGIANVTAGSITAINAGAYNPDRRTYLVGVDGSSNGYMARLYGDIYTSQVTEAITTASIGAIDTSLQPNNTGEIDLSGQIGWSSLAGGYKAKSVLINPNNDGTLCIAFSNGTNIIVGKVNADMIPVTNFGDSGLSNGLTAAIAMSTVNNITFDSDGNIIVTGANSGAQKVIMYNNSGVYQATFATTITSTNGSAVAQQKSGRYIISGYNGSTGLIIAYKNTSAISSAILAVDGTFGPASNNGYYETGINTPVDDICIDSNDMIYFTYRNASNVVCIGKLTANGSELVNSQNSPTTFNSGTIITTDITGVSGGNPCCIAINSAGNILVGNTRVTGLGSPTVQIALYNGSSGAQIGSTISVYNTSTPVLTKLVGAGTEFYGVIYNSASTISTFAITNTGTLDINFGVSGITSVSGSTYEYIKAVYGLSVQTDGKLVIVGYNNPSNNGTTFNPSLLRFFGYQYTSQYQQAPNRINAGQLDTTIWPTTGSFLLNNTTNSTFNSDLSGYAVKRVYESDNGVMTFIADNGNNTAIFQLLKDLTLNTSFNNSGYRIFNNTYGAASGLFVNSLGIFYITGNNNGASWLIGINSTGADLFPTFTPTQSLASSYAVNQQSNLESTRVIVAGQGSIGTGQANTHGYLLGYSSSGSLDGTFGASGQLDMNVTTAITDITIDANDQIIAVSNNSGSVILQRAIASGTSITTLSGGTAISTAISGSNIKVVLDNGGRIVVAAATSTGYILKSYNNDTTGTNISSASITPTGGGTFILSNIYATNDDKITLIGYESTSGKIVIARFTSLSGALSLDTASFDSAGPQPGLLYTTIGLLNLAYDGIIHADNRIMVAGSNSTSAEPYMSRAFGYPYASYVTQGPVITQAVPGTLNTTFGSSGTYNLTTLNALLNNGQGKAILPVGNGGYYIALDQTNTSTNSLLIKTISTGALDTTYNVTTGSIPGIAGTGTIPHYAPLGVNSILQDGSHNIVLVGTTGNAGWIQRYTSAGVIDSGFGSSGIINLASGTQTTTAIEQTLARLVVAGKNSAGNGALFAYKSLAPNGIPGSVDTTFNSTGSTPGVFATTIANSIACLIADSYDRLIFAILNGNAVDLYRLTPTGELDITFGTNGIVAGAISSASGATSVRVALDAVGNIIVASNSSTTNTFSVRSFDNGTSTATGANGGEVYTQLNISSLTSSPSVTNLVTSSDGYTFILGTQSGTHSAWIARITASGTLDTTTFNPAAIGGVAGIFKYAGSGSTAHIYNALAVNVDGTLGMLGYENSSNIYTPTLVSVYDDPYVSQNEQSSDSQPVGSNDITFGTSPITAINKGITFFGATGNINSNQVARTLALYNDNNIVVAVDGNSSSGAGTSEIMINMFDNTGIANPNFGSAGSVIALNHYENQYVRDMITFTTAAGVHKAIVAGYATNNTLSTTGSLLFQYILTPGASSLDSSFGGFDSNPTGVVFGNGQALYSVAQQSTGRIIAAGLSLNNVGLLLGYGLDGKMDSSFANNGYQSSNTGTTGIYTHAIDTNNNIVFAYNNGSNAVAIARYLADGSNLDSSFTTPTPLISTISGNNIKVAVDSSNRIYAAAVTNSGNTISAKIYPTTGGTALASINLTGTILGNSSGDYTLGNMIIDAAGNAIIAAYDTNAQKIIIIRLTSTLILDTTFNTIGYIIYSVNSGTTSQAVTDAIIHPDGRIIVSGSEN